jgi:hypothetical protein
VVNEIALLLVQKEYTATTAPCKGVGEFNKETALCDPSKKDGVRCPKTRRNQRQTTAAGHEQWRTLSWKVTMACRSCGSKDQTEFASEVSVHLLGLQNVDKPTVLAFPKLLVCMNCGFTESTLTENELRQLGENPARDVKAAG